MRCYLRRWLAQRTLGDYLAHLVSRGNPTIEALAAADAGSVSQSFADYGLFRYSGMSVEQYDRL